MRRIAPILIVVVCLSLFPYAYAKSVKDVDEPGKTYGLAPKVMSGSEFYPDRYLRLEDHSGAVKVPWNLSGSVMPVPPFGSRDIPGSDTASKLIVTRPNGVTVASITGIMRGLKSSTVYTVRISKGYSKVGEWSMTGTWVRNVVFMGSTYTHKYTTTQSCGYYAGEGRKPAEGAIEATEEVYGTVSDNKITFHTRYITGDPGYEQDAEGTIASDGSISGGWTDNRGRSGTWWSPPGSAKRVSTSEWPGYLTDDVEAFTFKTNTKGNGNWHINISEDDFGSSGEYCMSVWVREGDYTVLISDTIRLKV